MRRNRRGLSGGFLWGLIGTTPRALRQGRSFLRRGALLLFVMLSFAMLAGVGCQAQVQERDESVALRPPAELLDRVKGAQADFIGAMGSVAIDYDRVICGEVGAKSTRGFGRQAIAEATLEVSRARFEAQRATSARGGGPAEAHDGITLIEEPAEPPRSRLHWQCVQADAQPGCVQATANIVARRVYRERVDGYDLDPLVVSDLLEAFAADLRWAGDYLSFADTPTDAFQSIREACEAGDSPLRQYLGDAVKTDDISRRAGLNQLKIDMVGSEADLCGALPTFYAQIIQDLGISLAHHSRAQYCVNQPWAILD